MFAWRRNAVRDPVVDIERLLVDYAWSKVADTTFLDRRLKNRRYLLQVNWSYLDIAHSLTSFKLRRHDAKEHADDDVAKKPDAGVDKMKRTVLQRNLCLFRTEFTNASTGEQTFTFKTERKTTSRCDVTLQRGFRVGAHVDVRFSIPVAGQDQLALLVQENRGVEPCRVTGGLSGELHVTKTTGQTFEELLTWGVDSQVKVDSGSRVLAELIVREEELVADFTVESVIRAVQEVLLVYVKSRKTGEVRFRQQLIFRLVLLPSSFRLCKYLFINAKRLQASPLQSKLYISQIVFKFQNVALFFIPIKLLTKYYMDLITSHFIALCFFGSPCIVGRKWYY